MAEFTDEELAGFAIAQAETLRDTCVIRRYAAGARDGYNKPAASFTNDPPQPCGYQASPGREVSNGSGTVLADARIRLAQGQTLASKDRILITKRGKVVLTPALEYEVIGNPDLGVSGTVVYGQLVRGG